MSKKDDDVDEQTLRKLLDELATLVCNTGYWVKTNIFDNPEKIVIEDESVRNYIVSNASIFSQHLDWFLCETFCNDKTMVLAAILHNIQPDLTPENLSMLTSLQELNHKKRVDDIRCKAGNHLEVMSNAAIVQRALSSLVVK